MPDHPTFTEEELKAEIWKPVPGWEGCYEASSLGRIRSLDRQIVVRIKGRLLIPWRSGDRNYSQVRLYRNCSYSDHRIHTLVAQAFHGARQKGETANHKNGNTLDNRAWNLEWATRSEQSKHAWIMRRLPVYPRKHLIKLTAEELKKEIWKPILGFTRRYAISNLGRVRSLPLTKAVWYRGALLKPSIGSHGYARVSLCTANKSRYFSVHSLIALTFHGQRPKGLLVNHKDGIKLNNRPENLEYVTLAQNARHAASLGLYPTGDRTGLRKHPESRHYGDDHWTHKHPEWLARGQRNGMNTHPEKRLCGDNHWTRKHPEWLYRGERNGKARLSDALVEAIRSELKMGASVTELARRYHAGVTTIRRIKHSEGRFISHPDTV
jgi:HNH endonuclease/NUMOD4 motif